MSIKIISQEQLNQLQIAYRSLLQSESTIQKGSSFSILEVLERLLHNPGGLVRAQICLQTIINNGGDLQKSGLPIAIGIEYYHLASLIIDDLPSMDNAKLRRGEIAAHLQFGESNSILAALALINRAYSLIWSVIGHLSHEKQVACREIIDSSLGVKGIIQGQASDLSFATDLNNSKRTITKIADQKTGSLFRLSIVLPACTVVDNDYEIKQLERIAQLFGRIYQLIDDFKDIFTGDRSTDKSQRDILLHRPNMVVAIGKDEAIKYLNSLLNQAEKRITRISKNSDRWDFYRTVWNEFYNNAQIFV